MIVDIHTHIFPPSFAGDRNALCAREPHFAAMYRDPKARMATAEDLLASMDEAKVDVSIACGFWWDDPELAMEHATYLADVARTSGGRIVAFVPTFRDMPGAAGIGEVRVETAAEVPMVERPLLLHCSEEVGHDYPGKAGGLSPGQVWRLLQAQPNARVIAAHWGGGLPFFGLMPELRTIVDTGRLIFDSAASSFLYRPEVFRAAIDLVGVPAVAWGSDFPLRSQSTDLRDVRAALPDPEARAAVLGGNAARFLRLHD
jgi:predicted TIM-barrel fold metal-dependent hydrolase